MRLSQTYADHSAELLTMVNYIMGADGLPTEDAIRLGIDANDIAEISQLRLQFESAYQVYKNPNTHNAITIGEMRIADNNAYTVVLPFRQRIKLGKAELTPADYENLGIHEDKATRTPAEVPTDVPTLVIVEIRPMAITFEATEQSTEAVNRLRLPKRCRIAREMAIVPQGTEPTETDYHSLDTAGHSRFTLMFSAAEFGMNAYVRIAYENTAGRGPFSMPERAVIA